MHCFRFLLSLILEKLLRPTFSSSCGGLQPLAATVGPFGPSKKIFRGKFGWEIFFQDDFSGNVLGGIFFGNFLGGIVFGYFFRNFFLEFIFSRVFLWQLAGDSWQVVVGRCRLVGCCQ